MRAVPFAIAASVAIATAVGATSFARADASHAGDVDTLERQLGDEHAALSTTDCVTACKALGSIRRAAERICALEPGPRCADARAKADDAQRRVQAACPDCQLATAPQKDDERRAAEPAPQTAGAGNEAVENAPRKGGCASCSTPGERPTGDLGVIFASAFVASEILRRRSRKIVR